MPARPLPSLLILAAVVTVAACGGGAPSASPVSPSASSDTSPSATAGTPGSGGIGHATGPQDVLLRFEEGGGFVMPAAVVTETPIFTLYGDGAVVFHDTSTDPLPMDGAVIRQRALRTARLDEEQIQGLLEFAIEASGLGLARPKYDHPGIADAPTATFTVNVTGLRKTVEVYALGLETPDSVDAVARASFKRLGDRLRNFDDGGAIATDAYEPERYRGILMEPMGAIGEPITWPWTAFGPEAFVAPGDEGLPTFPSRTLTADEAAALGIDGIEGGVQGLTLAAKNGTMFSFALRPLLPDETR